MIDYQVGIVGSGFSGIIAGINLLNSSRNSFVIFEKAKEIGGVWRDNIYPGCACDIRSNLYSIKSEPNPNWSASYPSQHEVLQYLNNITGKYNLYDHIQFETWIVEMKFIESEGYWVITDNKNRCFKIKLMILATGPFRLPYIPKIPGIESFKGACFHSASWDITSDLSELNVAIIGTGASAAQIIPHIAQSVAKLFVFQRSATWVLPRWGSKNSNFIKRVYKTLPFIQKLYREVNYWFLEFIGSSFHGNNILHKILTRVALKKLYRSVNNPVTRAKLMPQYPFGCKRVILSDDFYPTFNKPNVKLITDTISKITKNKIFTDKGENIQVDAIIYATGFTVADIEEYIHIVGRNKRVLVDEWRKNGAEAYLGINVSGYPNLCFLLGPNSGLSHSSALHIIESQATYILQYLATLEKNGDKGFLDVEPESQKEYNLKILGKLKNKIWSSGCNSWFINKDQKNIVIYPGLTFQYRKIVKKFNLDNYLILNKESPRLKF